MTDRFRLPWWFDADLPYREATKQMVWNLGLLEFRRLFYGDEAPPEYGKKWAEKQLQEAYR